MLGTFLGFCVESVLNTGLALVHVSTVGHYAPNFGGLHWTKRPVPSCRQNGLVKSPYIALFQCAKMG